MATPSVKLPMVVTPLGGGLFDVTSETDRGITYRVVLGEEGGRCSCPRGVKSGGYCKHIGAAMQGREAQEKHVAMQQGALIEGVEPVGVPAPGERGGRPAGVEERVRPGRAGECPAEGDPRG